VLGVTAGETRQMQAQIAITEGPDKGRIWRLVSPVTYVIGRSSEAQIVLDDKTVSNRHAKIELVQGLWFVSDMSSKHGTRVNGAPIKARTALFEGDQVQLGKTVLTYRDRLLSRWSPTGR